MALIFDSLLLDAISILVAFFAILCIYVTRNFKYWEKRGVHSIRPIPFFGSIPGILLLRESIGCWLARKYEETAGKRFFGVYLLDKPALVVRDTELVKNVLVKDAYSFLDRTFTAEEDVDPMISKNLFGLNGSRWRHIRMKTSPTFTSGRMKKMFYLVEECAKMLANCLEPDASSGIHVNVKEMMTKYSVDVIASCAFGVNANAQVSDTSEFRDMIRSVLDRETVTDKITASMAFVLPYLVRLLRLKTVDADAENFVRKVFWDVVEERKKTGVARNDFMDLMIKLKDEGEVRNQDEDELEERNQDHSYSRTEHSKKDNFTFEMKDDDYVAQAFVFLLAGIETSASVLNSTLFELAMQPDIQERLRNEITATVAKNGGKLSYEVVTGMTYLEMVVSETLRKYPTLAFLDRVCLTNYKIPGTEVTIEKGTQVLIPALGIHYDPDIYPDPYKYDPERFSAANKCKRTQYAHLPFGDGPRICIGMRFGQMQVKTALIYILSSFQVRPCAETPKPPLHYKTGTLTHVPEEDIILVFRKLE